MTRKKAQKQASEEKSKGFPIPEAVWKELANCEHQRRHFEDKQRELADRIKVMTKVSTVSLNLEGEYEIDWNEMTFVEKG